MSNETNDPAEEKKPLLERLRNSFLPVSPADSATVRILKHSGFFLFALMALLISLVLGGAIMFVL